MSNSENTQEEKKMIKNPMHEMKNIPIYCLTIRRLIDNRIYLYAYYEDKRVLLCSALRLMWHIAAVHPIEFYKGNYFALRLFHKLEKVEQHIINSLLYTRYAQDFRTPMIEHLDPLGDDRVYKPIPSHFFEFPAKYIWGVIHFLNTLSINDNFGYEVTYHHDAVLKTYFSNKESPLPIEKIDELLDCSPF